MNKIVLFLLLFCSLQIHSQICGSGGCTAADTNATGKYPSTTFTTATSSWSTVSAYMNAGNYTLFNVTSGDTYQWTYCSDFGGGMGWDAELTLFNNATGLKLCYNDNCGRTNCSTAPYLQWTATFTGTVKLLTTVSGCTTNTGSPYSKLVWRDTSGVSNAPVLGVDVYSGNGTINWTQVKAAGYTFAWAKATEGVGYTDSEYLNFAVNGVTAGVKMGAYHFARGDLNPTNAGAINEANYFLSIAQPYITSCQLPPALDLEGSYWQTNFTPAQLTAWIQNWMTTVETATGIKPVLYIGSSNCSYVNSSLNVYPLWRDDLSNTPPSNIGVWTTWAINQNSWTGTVPGISGSQTDMDIFNGNISAFNNFINCITTDISKNSTGNSFVIYPNPANDHFIIESNVAEIQTVEVYDLNGRQVFTKSTGDKTIIDVSTLNEGVYTIAIKANNQVTNKKLVVLHQH